MTSKGLWKSDDITVQVFTAKDRFLTLTICDQKESKLFTLLLSKGENENEEENFLNEKHITRMLLDLRKLKVHSGASMQTNCTEAIGAEPADSSSGDIHLSLISLMALLFAKILMS